MKLKLILLFSSFTFIVFSQEFTLLKTSSITVSGTSTLHDWEVVAEKYSGTLSLHAQKSTQNKIKNGFISMIVLVVPMSDIHSEKGETMDNKIYKALKKDQFPNLRFELIEPIEFKEIGVENKILKIAGVLNIVGTGKKLVSIVEASFAKGVLSLSGNVPLMLSDYNIEPPSAMFGQIETGNDIMINFTLEFAK